MVLVGLLPILAFAGTIQAAAIPIDSTPPASPALSLPAGGGSATFSPVPTFSPQLGVPSLTFPNGPSFENTPDVHQNTSGGGRYTQDGSQGGLRSGTGVGRGKGMTNAERMRRGLGILPPTRRMTGKPSRRSGIPNNSPQVDAAQFQSPAMDGDGVVTTPNDGSVAETSLPDNNNQNQDQSESSDTNQDSNDNNTNNDKDNDQTADINNGRVLASKKYAMRMTNPEDGSDMGLITGPQGDDNPLIGYSPSPSDPLQMTMPTDPSSNPFSIVPGSNPDSSGNDSTFKGPRKLLAAVPHRTSTDPGSGDLMPGNGNYAPLGMGWKGTVPTYFVTGGDCSHTICLTADVNAFKDAQGDGAHEVHVLAEALADL
ncbi:hypothetical protein V865_001906 [Kwoniella europaea PYCC6329]|uniref:Uncharacterized protein n=1 Tax=Kwoniella europaea PYCC6329 TaxID=1423913 RepID=A0AAX4KE95_9TREE